jgi:16S rRNA (cytosine967-C5)-methyltransferase
MAAPLLLQGLPVPQGRRLRILDACAAPGGKTAHLLELCDAQVTALDVDPVRCERIGQTLARLGLRAQVVVADAGQPPAWWDGAPFDAILLDAPCTASGIVRRHPDVRWLRRESDIAALAVTQARLLAALWPLLAPGGRLLYCTCSVFRAEGEQQVAAFVARHKEALLLPSPGHLLPMPSANTGGLPDNLASEHDGFFYALLEKHSSAHPAA